MKRLQIDVDIELLFTDIKDDKGKKVRLSDEIMKLIQIWWDKKSQELKSSLDEARKEVGE